MDNFRDSYLKIDWDLSQKRLKGTFWGKQYDTGRGFEVTVINGGQVLTATTEVLRLKWEKPDNTAGYVNATVVNGKFVVENIDQMFTVQGSIRADFDLQVAGESLASITFYVSVEKAVAVDAIESSSDFTALQDALADVGDIQAQVDAVIANATVDSEVILARGTEATLGARLDSTDAQLAEIEALPAMGIPDADNSILMKNVVSNGDFSSSSKWWAGEGSSNVFDTVNNQIINTGGGTVTYPQIIQTHSGLVIANDKIYVRAQMKVDSAKCNGLLYMMKPASGATYQKTMVSNPTPNEWYGKGHTFPVEPSIVGETSMDVHAYHRYGSASDATGKLYVKNFIAINLTKHFGSGNEPSTEQVDLWLDGNYPTTNGWFDGEKLIKRIGYSNGMILGQINNEVRYINPSDVINGDTLKFNNLTGDYKSDNIGDALREIGLKIGGAFDNTFEFTEAIVDVQDIINVAYPTFQYGTSTFSGWGGAIGNPTNFDCIYFEFKNRLSNTSPITKVRLRILKTDGTKIFDRIYDTSVQPGETKKFIARLGSVIANEGQEQLWAFYQCNQLIEVLYGQSKFNLNPPTYRPTAYATGGSLGDAIVNVTDGTLSNIGKPVIFAGNYINFLRAGEGFLDGLDVPPSPIQYEPVKVILPKEYKAVVGDTFQLFYRGIIEALNPYNYDIRVHYTGQNGKNYPRYFQLNPTATDVGLHTLTIIVQTHSGQEVGRGTTKIRVKAVGSQPQSPVNILCIGDSLTSAGTWVQEANRRISQVGGVPAGKGLSNFNFIGTKSGNYNTRWEGYGGWTWASYLAQPSLTTLDMWVYVSSHDKTIADQHSLWNAPNGSIWKLETIEPTRLKFTRHNNHTSAMPTGNGTLTHNSLATNQGSIIYTSTVGADGNPFWNSTLGVVDFVDYCSRNGFSGIDYVYTLLTWNGMSAYRTENNFTDHINNAKTLINRIHEQYPNAKIRMCGIQLPSLNGGMGANYGAGVGSYSETFGNVVTVFAYNQALQNLANDPLYSPFCEFINISGQFDSENNMPETTTIVNTRSAKTERIGTNGVHPSTEGYYQIGDAVYRSMIGDITT